jgi:DNA (cytosine-5)-methyltransferase 1
MTTRTYRVADLFCGAGGSSSGAARAVRAIGGTLELVAVNHWDVAIATHSRNHPQARHHCIDLDAARPEELVPEGSLDLLMASPECVFFSRARGGRPVHDQRRMSAWHVQRWASALDIRCILVENVPEFRDWGPLLPNGRPEPKGKGLYFEAWLKALWAMGYAVDWRLLNAANYGDATTRVRFFLQARKDGRPIRWPEPTHSPTGEPELFGQRPRWRAAREVIDWTNPGRSLLGRKRPLSLKTRLRIARGLQRFGGPLAALYIDLLDLPAEDLAALRGGVNGRGTDAPQPFVLANRNNNTAKGVDAPAPTFTTAGGGGVFVTTPVAEPFVSPQRKHTLPRSVQTPLPTITAANGSGGMALVEPVAEPFVLGQQSGAVARETEQPLPTIATAGAISLVEPSLIPYYGTGVADSVDAPLATVTTKARFGLCCPLVVPYGPKAEARGADQPLPTVLTKDRLGVATPVIVPFNGDKGGPPRPPRSVDEPLATITTEPRFGVATPSAEPFIVPQFGERDGQPPRVHDITQPVPTVTSHGAGALVEPVIIQTDQTGGNGAGARSLDQPLGTIVTKQNVALVEPALIHVAHGGEDDRSRSVEAPLPAITTKRSVALIAPTADPVVGEVDPRRLVLIDGVPHLLDIRFRMLTNRELARAMGFDDDGAEYTFTGNVSEVTRQIGNAVAVNTAAALVRAVLEEPAP